MNLSESGYPGFKDLQDVIFYFFVDVEILIF
jgi:hypothetical protein